MRAYVDSSVILRLLLGQPGSLKEWHDVERAIASSLLRVECLRVFDRLRLTGALDTDESSRRRAALESSLASFDIVEVSGAVLDRASEPMPVSLGTLDAVHLATALLWREEDPGELVFVTHDAALAEAARLYGFPVAGA